MRELCLLLCELGWLLLLCGVVVWTGRAGLGYLYGPGAATIAKGTRSRDRQKRKTKRGQRRELPRRGGFWFFGPSVTQGTGEGDGNSLKLRFEFVRFFISLIGSYYSSVCFVRRASVL